MAYNFIHIPKTAGSSLRITLKRTGFKGINYHPHRVKLNQVNNVMFVIRDPFERFCGAYYERKNTEAYNKAFKERRKDFKDLDRKMIYGGPQSKQDKGLYKDTETPNDLMTKIRNSNGRLNWVLDYPRAKGPTAQVFGSYKSWLGDLRQYQANESRVKHAIDISVFTSFLQDEFDLTLTSDKVLTRNLTDNKDYNLSEENREWYRNLRRVDFNLYEHIKAQPYYRS